MPIAPPTRPIALYALLFGLVVLGLGGIVGGYFLVLDPTGSSLGLPASLIEGSVFPDYLVPGIALLVFLGMYPLLAAAALWRRAWWAQPAAALAGLLLLLFLTVEILTIGYFADPPFQIVFGLVGAVLLVLSFTPSVRAYCQKASLDQL